MSISRLAKVVKLSEDSKREEILDYISRAGFVEKSNGIWESKIDTIIVDASGEDIKAKLTTESDDKFVVIKSVNDLIIWFEDKQMNGEA